MSDYPRLSRVECREVLAALRELRAIVQKRHILSYSGSCMEDLIADKRAKTQKLRDLADMIDAYAQAIPKPVKKRAS